MQKHRVNIGFHSLISVDYLFEYVIFVYVVSVVLRIHFSMKVISDNFHNLFMKMFVCRILMVMNETHIYTTVFFPIINSLNKSFNSHDAHFFCLVFVINKINNHFNHTRLTLCDCDLIISE